MNKIKTCAIRNKKVAFDLIHKGFELLNITKNRYSGKPCYIFEITDAFKEALDCIKNKSNTLTKNEISLMLDILKCRQYEFRSICVDTASIDAIIDKLKSYL